MKWTLIRHGWVSATLALLLAGCASSPPAHFYTLTPLATGKAEPQRPGDEMAVGLGAVSFPVFLDRPQIVSRTDGNRLQLTEFQRWGGTLQDDFVRVWSENLATLLDSSRVLVFPTELRFPLDFRVTAEVLAFEGLDDDQALLKVRWAVLDPYLDEVLTVRESSYRRPLALHVTDDAIAPDRSGTSRARLVAALSQTLADFSREVAAVLRELPRPTAPAK